MSASFRDFREAKNTKYVWHLGDCLDLLKTLPDNSVQLLITSPPYSIGKEYERGSGISKNLTFQDRVIAECVRVLKPSGSICWQVASTYERAFNKKGKEVGEQIPWDILLHRYFVEKGLKLRNRIIWHYEHGTHAVHRFSNRYEMIMWFTKTDDYTFNLDSVRVPQKFPGKRAYKGPNKGQLSGHPDGKNPGDVWSITNVKNGHPERVGAHPCQFPIALAEKCIKAFSDSGDLVVDPFGGVATTVVSALQHGRIPLSAEINKEYHRYGLERIKSLFGVPARKGNRESLGYYVLRRLPEQVVS